MRISLQKKLQLVVVKHSHPRNLLRIVQTFHERGQNSKHFGLFFVFLRHFWGRTRKKTKSLYIYGAKFRVVEFYGQDPIIWVCIWNMANFGKQLG